MKAIKIYMSGLVLFLVTVMLFSCNLEDFDLKKLANPDDITPDIFAPLAYGTFKVSSLTNTPFLNSDQIPAGGLSLDPVNLNKTGTSFRSAAIDSVYLITYLTNDTPCNIEFDLSFVNSFGTQLAAPFTSGIIPANTTDKRIQFDLGPVDQDNLQKASAIKLAFKISSPDPATPITYGAVKTKSFTVKISFHAPVDLTKLSN